ncbi:MAG: zeta toxin family protein [Lactobacillus sp.]|nr:zeta toxin family protein [Lactobacillus sp.]
MKNLYIVAGINGAGKSTLYETDQDLFKNSKRINADEIAKKNNWDWRDSTSNYKALMKVHSELKHAMQLGQSINIETTLASSVKSYRRLLERAKNKNYTVNLIYIGLDSDNLAVKRVNHRVRIGGHGVPERTIKIRYKKSVDHLSQLIYLFDNVRIYNNTDKFEVLYIREGKRTIIKSKKNIKWAKKAIENDVDFYNTK